MTEQCKHEWTFVYGDLLATCKDFPDCNVAMHPEELTRRLNATERLSAEWVRIALDKLERILATDAGFLADLRAYANILEGKDE